MQAAFQDQAYPQHPEHAQHTQQPSCGAPPALPQGFPPQPLPQSYSTVQYYAEPTPAPSQQVLNIVFDVFHSVL